jgi:hypothetical protein
MLPVLLDFRRLAMRKREHGFGFLASPLSNSQDKATEVDICENRA